MAGIAPAPGAITIREFTNPGFGDGNEKVLLFVPLLHFSSRT